MSSKLTTNRRNADFISVIQCHKVEFVVVGGLAVVFHGCRDKFEVDDLDLMLEPTIENMTRFIGVLSALNFHPNWQAQSIAKPNIQIPLKHDYYLDILTPPQDMEFGQMKARCCSAELNGYAVNVISCSDLITLKRIALSEAQKIRNKHADDLACLEST